MTVLTAVLALFVGVLMGLLGGGGSILMVPIFTYLLNMGAHQAITLSLLIVGLTSLVSAAHHAHRGRVRFKTAGLLGVASMLGAFSAGKIAHLIPPYLRLMSFAFVMLVTALAMIRGIQPRVIAVAKDLTPWEVSFTGLAIGAFTGLVGAGGGFLVVPVLVILGGLPMPSAVGTSLLVIGMNSIAGFLGSLAHTPVDWALGLKLSALAVVGSLWGATLTDKLPAKFTREAFGWFVLTMALAILMRELPKAAGVKDPTIILLLIPAIGMLIALRMRYQSRVTTEVTDQPITSPASYKPSRKKS